MKQIIIDCRAVSDSAQLHDFLARELDFPDWYGHNLDALYDCLTEMEEPTALILTNWDSTADWTDGFAQTLCDAATDNPDFTVKMQ